MNMRYTRLIGTWSLFIGMVLSIATVFITFGDWISQVLIILGFLAGFFHSKLRDELITLGIIYLCLAVVATTADSLIAFGPFISDIASAFVRFLGPVVLIVAMFWGGAFLMVNEEKKETPLTRQS